jgi:hypothetical protein
LSVDRPPEEYYFPLGGGEPSELGGRQSPSWRGVVISIIVAIILSVTATLLLGGIFRP